MSNQPKFENTPYGYLVAKNYLKAIGEWIPKKERGTSDDHNAVLSEANESYASLAKYRGDHSEPESNEFELMDSMHLDFLKPDQRGFLKRMYASDNRGELKFQWVKVRIHPDGDTEIISSIKHAGDQNWHSIKFL